MAYIDPRMPNTDFGTEGNDILPGSMGNDIIFGDAGDDLLLGLAGSDALDGGVGDDTIDGGFGDDTLLGGAGNDTLIATAGNDNLDGGIGNDHFVINGFAGDIVHITDTEGRRDTLDARGAITSADIDLRPGSVSYVDGRQIHIAGGSSVEIPLDLVLTQDLSGSFGDDVFTVQGLLPNLIAAVNSVATTVRWGVTSFVDKPTSPFGDAASGDYEFKIDLGLTSDSGAFAAVVNSLGVKFGGDEPESQLSALLHNATQGWAVGWNTGALKVVVLTTDATFHLAGDHSTAPPNNGDEITDGPGDDGTGEDYPTIAQVKAALESLGIIPIFAVTSDVKSSYQSLVDQLKFGAVVDLSSSSDDIIQAFEDGLSAVTETTIERAIGGRFDDTITGNNAANELMGRGGDDILRGLKGRDTLVGGSGDDRLYGGGREDTLDGGRGDDRMWGNSGADSFRFENNHGDDRIMDFDDGQDMMDMGGTGLTFADLTIAASGSDTLVTSSEGSILIMNVAVADIDATDFIF